MLSFPNNQKSRLGNSQKNPYLMMEGMLENLTGAGGGGGGGGGGYVCGNPDGRGALNLKILPQGLLSISLMFQLP